MAGERTRVLLCNMIGGGSGVLLEGCDDGTGPITIGKQTEGGRAASGEAEAEEDDVTEGTSVDDGGPHPGGTTGVEITVGVPTDDTGDGRELSMVNDPPTAEVDPIRGGSAGSHFVSCPAAPVFPVITTLGTVVKSCPGACVLQSDADLRGKARGVDVNGGGSGPAPLLTLRLSGGSRGTALSFFLELLLPPSLPLAESADDEVD